MIGPRVIIFEFHRLLALPCSSSEVITYRYLETVSCADQDNWSRFIRALASQLSSSGLGSSSDKVKPIDDTTTSDLLIRLRNIDYGRALVEECVRKNHISIERPIVPQRWITYRCDEYFADNWWNPEHYNPEHLWAGIPESHMWNGILDYTQVYEDFEHEFLAIASSGCDGIDFGYRKYFEGLWAYYPLKKDFKLMAPTIPALREGWCDGSLSV